MKLRIQDNSLRLRLTLVEVAALAGPEGAVVRRCQIPGAGCFTYSLRLVAARAESAVLLEPHAIVVELSCADYDQLADPAHEGVYIHREWTEDAGQPQRFMAAIEKDRPASTCKKVEAWIYEGHHGGDPTLSPIPAREK